MTKRRCPKCRRNRMKIQGGSCQLKSKREFCLACSYDHTQRCENTHAQVTYMCICSESCFMPQNCCCTSPHLYTALLSHLFTHHSQLTSRIPAGAAYLKLPISISSSRRAAAPASPGSLFPAGIQHLGAPRQRRARTRLLRHRAKFPFASRATRLSPG